MIVNQPRTLGKDSQQQRWLVSQHDAALRAWFGVRRLAASLTDEAVFEVAQRGVDGSRSSGHVTPRSFRNVVVVWRTLQKRRQAAALQKSAPRNLVVDARRENTVAFV
jgi:hypothetical protein